MREKEGYHEQYAALKARFPGREAISLSETCEILGLSRYQITKLIKAKRNPLPATNRTGTYIITLSNLARYLC